MGGVRLSLWAMIFTGMLSVTSVGAGDKPICSAMLLEDAALMKALPDSLHSIVESARFRNLLVGREAAWAGFHQALDQGLKRPGRPFLAKLDGHRSLMVFQRGRSGELRLKIISFSPSTGAKNLGGGLEFLDLVGAQLGWIAKAKAAGNITNLTLVAEDILNLRLADTLAALGFKKGSLSTSCYMAGLVGAISGYVGGKIYFILADSHTQGTSIDDEARKYHRDVWGGTLVTGGTVGAVMCLRRSGKSFSLEFKPEEAPSTPPPAEPKPPAPEPAPPAPAPVPPPLPAPIPPAN